MHQEIGVEGKRNNLCGQKCSCYIHTLKVKLAQLVVFFLFICLTRRSCTKKAHMLWQTQCNHGRQWNWKNLPFQRGLENRCNSDLSHKMNFFILFPFLTFVVGCLIVSREKAEYTVTRCRIDNFELLIYFCLDSSPRPLVSTYSL